MSFGICNQTKLVRSKLFFYKIGLKRVFYKLVYREITKNRDSLLVMRNNLFQAAVPKSMSLQLFPPSSPTIPPGGSVTQQLEVNNPSNAALKMRLKISFIAEGIPIADQVDQLSNFPAMAS